MFRDFEIDEGFVFLQRISPSWEPRRREGRKRYLESTVAHRRLRNLGQNRASKVRSCVCWFICKNWLRIEEWESTVSILELCSLIKRREQLRWDHDWGRWRFTNRLNCWTRRDYGFSLSLVQDSEFLTTICFVNASWGVWEVKAWKAQRIAAQRGYWGLFWANMEDWNQHDSFIWNKSNYESEFERNVSNDITDSWEV